MPAGSSHSISPASFYYQNMEGLIPIEKWWREVEKKYMGKSAMELARWYIALRRRSRIKLN